MFSQAVRILRSIEAMLLSVGSDLQHMVHIRVFLEDMADFDRMNEAYVEVRGDRRPARTVIAAHKLLKPGFRVLMNLIAVTIDP